MKLIKRATPLLALLLAVVMIGSLSAPSAVEAADHLDAAGILPPGGDIQADINDLYAFAGSSGNTVLAVTVHPAATSLSTFGSDVLYQIKVDTNDDAVEDISYKFHFSDPRADGSQFLYVLKATGTDAVGQKASGGDLVAFGEVENTLSVKGGGQIYTGLRSDPFFFDFNAFLGTVEGAPTGQSLTDGMGSDFFAPLDVLSMVLEVPDTALANGNPIGVWTTTGTSNGTSFTQIDRTGRPAVNTVVNSTGPIIQAPAGAKKAFNEAEPVNDEQFRSRVVDALLDLSALDSEGAYSTAQANALADVLIPDVLPFDKNETTFPAPLEGRALADDVIDTELRVFTGGDPLGLFADRNADGAINSDFAPPHTDYLTSFPYLGAPHAMVQAEYKITIENLTDGQPFSPPVAVTHSSGFDMATVGSAASDALAAIAQDGNPGPMVALASGSSAVTDVVAGVPLGTQTKQVGPFAPTQSFGITAASGDVLSLATMLICTNDGFLGVDSVALPASGSLIYEAKGYDAGREQNTQQSSDIVQPCTLLGPTALPGDPDGNSNAATEDGVIRLHPGIQSGVGELTPPAHGWSDPVARITVERLTAPFRDVNDFRAELRGANEVPAVAASGSGVSALALSDDGTALDHIEITYGLQNVTAAHIHVGDADENGPVVTFLFGPDSGTTSNGTLADATVNASDLVAGSMSDLADILRGGFAYVNVHSTANPAGVVRGQVEPLDAVGNPGARFNDDNGNVHEANIEIIAAAGITIGCNPDGTAFCPGDATTRGQMAAFLNRSLNLPDSTQDFFTDDNGSIFEDDINRLAAAGITTGTSATTFSPDEPVTRGQMAAFIARAWDLPTTSQDFFTDDNGTVHEADINRLAAAGVTKGTSPTTFEPSRTQRRDEMASFLARAFNWGS